MVPNGWEFTTFENHIDLLSGFAFKSAQYTENSDDIRLLRGDNIAPNTLRWDGVKTWDKHQYAELQKYHLRENDFVIAMDRTWVSSGLKVAEVTKNDLPCLLVQRVARIRSLPTLEQSLLRQYFSSHRFEQYVKGVQTETAVPHISSKQIKEFPLLLPPLPEQRKIAQILSTWDRGIAITEKLIDASKQQKKALMQQLLTGKKRLSNPKTGKVFEGEWEEVKLANICSKITDGAHHSPASVEEGFPMYSVKDMGKSGFKKGTARLIAKEDYLCLEQQNCRPLVNDILIAKDGSILKHCFVMEKQCDGVILSSIAILRPDLEKICPAFVAHFLSQDYVKKYVAKVFTTGSGVPRIVLKDFKSIKLKLGSLAEQQKIASVLTVADKDIELLEAKLAHFKQEKKALMQQLLTGKRRVKVEHMEEATC